MGDISFLKQLFSNLADSKKFKDTVCAANNQEILRIKRHLDVIINDKNSCDPEYLTEKVNVAVRTTKHILQELLD